MENDFSRAVLGEDFESGLKFPECALRTKYKAGRKQRFSPGDGKVPQSPQEEHIHLKLLRSLVLGSHLKRLERVEELSASHCGVLHLYKLVSSTRSPSGAVPIL